jgi:hypothetical protein
VSPLPAAPLPKSATCPASGPAAQHRNSCCRREPRQGTGGLLTLPRPSRPVHRRPYHQVSGLHPSAAVQAEPRQFKRLAVNLAVTGRSDPTLSPPVWSTDPGGVAYWRGREGPFFRLGKVMTARAARTIRPSAASASGSLPSARFVEVAREDRDRRHRRGVRGRR